MQQLIQHLPVGISVWYMNSKSAEVEVPVLGQLISMLWFQMFVSKNHCCCWL
jgi:hypothetical protein